jgi:amino acid transporter
MIQVVCIGTLPGQANSERLLVDASSRFLGASGASILSAGALISVTGTLNSIMLSAPRILFAMAEQDQLPQLLAATLYRNLHFPAGVAVQKRRAVAAIQCACGCSRCRRSNNVVRLAALKQSIE